MSRLTITRPSRLLSPFRSSPSLADELVPSLSREMDQLAARASEFFGDSFGMLPAVSLDRVPPVNVSEDKHEYTVTAELPGMTMKDITVEYGDGMLTIKGQSQQEDTKQDDRNYYVWERRSGSFQRTLSMPAGIVEEKLSAEYKDGVLTVHMPKSEDAKAKKRAVPVQAKS